LHAAEDFFAYTGMTRAQAKHEAKRLLEDPDLHHVEGLLGAYGLAMVLSALSKAWVPGNCTPTQRPGSSGVHDAEWGVVCDHPDA